MTRAIVPAIFLLFFIMPAKADSYLQLQPQAERHWYTPDRKASPKAKKPRAVKRQRQSTVVAKRDAAPRSCLAAPAAALLAGLEAACGPKRIVKTCCPGCQMTLSPGKLSWHAKRLAFDTEETSAAGKACTVAYLERQKKGTVITYGWLSKVVHADVGNYVKRIHAGKADTGAQWPIAQVVKTVPNDPIRPPVHDIDAPTNKSHRLASVDPGQMLDDSEPQKSEPQEAVAIWAPVFYFNSPGVWKPTALPVNLPPQSNSIRRDIEQAAEAFSVDPVMMKAFARIESGFRCHARTGSYKGLFQLSDWEFKKYWHGNIYSCRDNAIAAARKFKTESEQFENDVGRQATAAELYMIHQQGYQGASFHYAAPHQIAAKNMHLTAEGQRKGEAWAKRAIIGNVPHDVKKVWLAGAQTSGDFIRLWTGRVEHFMARKVEPPSHYASATKRTKVAAKKRKIRLAQR